MGSRSRHRILGAFKVNENTPILFIVHRSRIHSTLLTRLLLALLLLLARGVCPGAAESACCSEPRPVSTCVDEGCCAADRGECEEGSRGSGHHRSAGEESESPSDDDAGASQPCAQGCCWCMSFTTMGGALAMEEIPLYPTSFAALPIPSITGAHGVGIDHPPC